MTARRKSSTRRSKVSAPARPQIVADKLGTTAAVLKETSTSTATATPTSDSSVRPNPASPTNEPTTPARSLRPLRLQSLNSTPIKVGSHSNGPTTSSASTATHAQTRQSEPAAPAPMTQAQLDINIESEMHNAIFRDPNFVAHFLSRDSKTLDAVLEYCRQSDGYDAGTEQWGLPNHISSEAALYTPVVRILNSIKRSVDRVRNHPPADDQAFNLFSDDDPDNVPLMPDFRDRHSRAVNSDEAETAGLKPDIVLFNHHELEHWETVRMSIEIKKLPTYHKAAMKQLSRYARATFAHQLHRRHLFGLTICGTEATFVLFDRAGILYSPRIDMKSQFEDFTRAFASLLLLDPTGEGYDPMFKTEMNGNRRLKYYVDLPIHAFEDSAPAPAACPRGLNQQKIGHTRRFEVIDRLCHRKSIRGRATIVLRLREVLDSENLGKMRAKIGGKRKRDETEGEEGEGQEVEGTEELTTKDYVLKIIWRDPGRDSEGEVMEHFRGMFGLAQHVWHSDAPGRCRCASPAEGPCWAPSCVSTTAHGDKIEVCDNLRDIAIPVPMDAEDAKEKDYIQVDTTQHHPTSSTRKLRICSYILMSSIGVLLSEANDPSEFMNAVLDAILGYWRLFNMGVLHRDISDGNVMILHREDSGESDDSELNKPERRNLPEKPWLAAMRHQEPVLAESEEMLQTFLARLRRSPTGMLSDFDLHAKHTHLEPWCTSARIHAAGMFAGNVVGRTSPPTGAKSGTVLPESKRRQTNSRQGLPVSSTPSQATTSRASTIRPEIASHVQDRQEGKIDFRTGTPAFMSIRVSSILPGTPYHHSYLDDLESFLWLILWSAAAHCDEDSTIVSSGAQHVLDQLSSISLKAIGDWKISQLTKCASRSGERMEETLQLCQNQWASDPIFSKAILGLGRIFHDVDEREIPFDAPPTFMFPRVVNVIMDALNIA